MEPNPGVRTWQCHRGLAANINLCGEHRSNLVLATVKGVKEPWAVITDESPTLKTLWQYALRFRVEELFLEGCSQQGSSTVNSRPVVTP